MHDRLLALDESSREHIVKIAQALAQYGLGISVPHMHSVEGGTTLLPIDVVSHEDNLSVRFVSARAIPIDSEAVGWRWANNKLSPFAYCCGDNDPPWLVH